jgi:hypothetical protein
MPRRAIHLLVLDLALVAATGFYLLAPTVYAYVSEVSMSYALLPPSLAATLPARLTERLYGRYNIKSPVAARLRLEGICHLTDEGAKRDPGCRHEVANGESAVGPSELKLAAGSYAAHFDFSGNDVCADGEAELAVETMGPFARVLARSVNRIQAGQRFDVPFTLTLRDASFGPIEFRVSGRSGCVLLSRLDWSDLPLIIR